jgi:hypothetical protein
MARGQHPERNERGRGNPGRAEMDLWRLSIFTADSHPTSPPGKAGQALRCVSVFRQVGRAGPWEQGKDLRSAVGFGHPIRSSAGAEAGGHAHAHAQPARR